jgi:hypothetical protein
MPAAMNPNAGMSEQEQQMVKAVCATRSCKGTLANIHVDANGHGILYRQDSHGRCHGWWSGCHVRTLHGFRMCPTNS